MSSTFNITEWVLKNTIKEGSKKTIYDFIEHVVHNWRNELNEAYDPKTVERFVKKFSQQADDRNVNISDDQLRLYINSFDNLRKSHKIQNKDLGSDYWNIGKLIRLVTSSPGAEVPGEEEEETGPDVIYSENGYTIYSGGNEELCQRHRNDVPWCITRTSFGNYRYSKDRNFPSFYLIKNTNLPDSDKLSFVAIQVRGDGSYVWTNRKNSPNESDRMGWESLNSDIPWLQNIPNVKNLLKYIPLSSKEKSTQQYGSDAINFRDWENLPFTIKKQYIVVRKNKSDLFNDVTRKTFVGKYLPDYPQLATFIATNADLMDPEILLANLDKFTPNDRKSITANLRELIDIRELNRANFSFDVKKLLVKLNKFETKSDERLYVTKDNNSIVKLKFGEGVRVAVFTEERDYPDIKLNKRTSRFILDYPEIDKLPIPTVLRLMDNEVVDIDFVNKILEKATTDPNSAVVVKDTDAGKIVLDSNSFTSYKIENGKLSSIPFDSEEVQKALEGEESNTGFQKSAVELVFGAKTLPATIERGPFLQILNNTPYDKRKGIARDRDGVILVNPSAEDQPIFVIDPNLRDGKPDAIIDYGRRTGDGWRTYDYANSIGPQNWPTVIKYYRDTNQPFSDRQIKGLLMNIQNKNIAKLIVQANPLMAQDSTLKPILVNDVVILLNTRDPRSSFIVSDRSGKLLNKVISNIQANQILGLAAAPQVAAPAAGERRRGRPAGGAAQPAAPAAPQEGALNLETVFTEAGLQQGFQNMSPSLRRALANPVAVPTFRSRGASRRNNLLGNRGRVVRVLEAGRSSIYIIRLAGNNGNMASINIQPGNGHLVVLPNGTVLNIGSPTNLVNTLTQRGLAENLAHAVVSEFLAQNPTMIDEAKNALRLISKNKKS